MLIVMSGLCRNKHTTNQDVVPAASGDGASAIMFILGQCQDDRGQGKHIRPIQEQPTLNYQIQGTYIVIISVCDLTFTQINI